MLDKNLREAIKSVARNPSLEALDLVYLLIESLGERYDELKVLLVWCAATHGEERPLGAREFISAISKNSPICAIFHDSK